MFVLTAVFSFLLIAKTVLSTAIGALPGDPVAGHAPDIFMHAGLADAESTSTLPAKGKFLPTAVALLERLAAPASFSNWTGGLGHHADTICRLVVCLHPWYYRFDGHFRRSENKADRTFCRDPKSAALSCQAVRFMGWLAAISARTEQVRSCLPGMHCVKQTKPSAGILRRGFKTFKRA